VSDVTQKAADLVLSHADQMLVGPPGRAALFSPEVVYGAMRYLYWFGYLVLETAETLENIIDALTDFQEWFRVNDPREEGKLGVKTLKAMAYPRCGCPDIVDHNNGRHVDYMRLQRFRAASNKRWHKEGLRFHIKTFIDEKILPRDVQRNIVLKAWQQWMHVANLRITETNSEKNADLVIATGRGAKDDFDGPAGTLAWAYMPDGHDEQLLMRFDSDELWTSDVRDNGVCMLNVACHEFGHMLGLNHSRAPQALMAPFYNESVAAPQKNDDIPKIQKLYGVPRAKLEAAGAEKPLTLRITGQVEIEGFTLVPVESDLLDTAT